MTRVFSISAFSDNYIWCAVEKATRKCVIVDPGEASPVISTLEREEITPTAILITHHHWDHTQGVAKLCKTWPVPVFGPENSKFRGITDPLKNGDTLKLLNMRFSVIATPGHTMDHIAYYDSSSGSLFCGDTLFSGGCGRLFEGSPEIMYHSLQTLASLPPETLVYAAHEYTLDNLRFATHVDPENEALANSVAQCEKLRAAGQPTLPTTIAKEREINPFLTLHGDNEDEKIAHFAELRKQKDKF